MTRPRESLPVRSTAPTATGDDTADMDPASWPATPPRPVRAKRRTPVFRPLKVYAFGPSLGRAPGNVRTINVRYEPLAPGPVGARVAVVDFDAARQCFYDPVDLDDPLIAMNGGLDPSESDPHFHQQMVYALASESLRRIEVALGRTVQRRSPEASTPLHLVIYPHGGVTPNAYSVGDRMVFGYFRAVKEAVGRTLPDQTVFACLSHDVIVHLTAHMILSAMRPDLDTMQRDTAALQEALADLTPLLFHLNYRDVVLDTIQRTAGVIYRSQLDLGTDPDGGSPRILAEIASSNPLLAVSQDFAEALGQTGGIRNALLAPDPTALDRTDEPHARGAIVLAAVFDALFSIYQRRTLDLFRIFRAGGGRLQGNDVPEPLANRLCDEIERIAARVFNMCWRAADYCPATTIELGDFLRACITADFEYSRDDPWGLRDAIMQAFRLRGIKSSTAAFFTEDAMRWPAVAAGEMKTAGPADLSQNGIRAFVATNARVLGLPAGATLDVYPIEVSQLTAPDDSPQTKYFTQVIVSSKQPKGVTLVFDAGGSLRYAIPSTLSVAI